jgi:hypothetical protein
LQVLLACLIRDLNRHFAFAAFENDSGGGGFTWAAGFTEVLQTLLFPTYRFLFASLHGPILQNLKQF